MLSSHQRLAARQGQWGTPRHEYLQQLVSEYARSPDRLRKEEIVANLANFAYDPINYVALRHLRVMELFVEIISSPTDIRLSDFECKRDDPSKRRAFNDSASVVRSNQLLQEFAMGGICNCIPDPALQVSFIESHGCLAVLDRVLSIRLDSATADMNSLSEHPSAERERRRVEMDRSAMNLALSALTIAYFLLDSPAFATVTSGEILDHMRLLTLHPNVRVANVAKAFRSRYDELLASIVLP